MKGVKGILLIGGQGARFCDILPKQFALLEGLPVYQWSLQTLLSTKVVESVVVVSASPWVSRLSTELAGWNRVTIVPGADTRQKSAYNGIMSLEDDTEYVIIQDGARPFLSLQMIEQHIHHLPMHPALNTCIPAQDTVVEISSPTQSLQKICNIPERSNLLIGQTPQSFHYSVIKEAHISARKDGIEHATDDCQLALRMGVPVTVLPGCKKNIKITFQEDLAYALHLIQSLNLKKTFFPDDEEFAAQQAEKID